MENWKYIEGYEGKYKAKFDYMTENLIFFENGFYKIAEIKSNYRRTWKVRAV